MMIKSIIVSIAMVMCSVSMAQTLINQGSYSSSSLVDTNSTSVSTSTVNTTNNSTSTSVNTNNSTVNSNNVNTNNNVNSGTVTYNNNNVQSGTLTNINQNTNNGTMTYNNNNVNSGTVTNIYQNTSTSNINNNNTGTMTYNNNNVTNSVNTNNNVNSGTMTYNNNNMNNNVSTANNINQNIQSGELINRNYNDNNVTQRVIQPPPTAIAPPMMSMGSDLCVTGVSGATQTQIFGLSFGSTQRDYNCERLKLAKTLYDMGMKVAAVATMCQDRRVFDAMMAAGTPCPVEGRIGDQARAYWEANQDKIPVVVRER